MNPAVSIIIPAKSVASYLRENIKACQAGSYRNFEIIVLVDKPPREKFPKTCFIATGSTGPAQKRDMGARQARGKILAFIDDDAYPTKYWLARIIKNFEDPKIGAVGGPGVTPRGVGWREEASGWVSASPLGSGEFMYRFLPLVKRFVDDYPSMNLAVRRSDFEKAGGFDSNFWPGEDTKLCLDLVKKLGRKIVYEPQAVVYHHRRPLWIPHLRQHGNFGIHRGYFARILPETSARPVYFAPSALVLGLFFLTASFLFGLTGKENSGFFETLHLVVGIGLLAYFLMLVLNGFWIAFRSKKVLQGLMSIPAVFITHAWYGIRFIQGFIFTKRLS